MTPFDQPQPPEITVLSIRPVANAGNVRAYASIRLGPLVIHDCKVVQQPNQRPWVSLPQVQDDGRWWPLVQIADPRLRHMVCQTILGAWRQGRFDLD